MSEWLPLFKLPCYYLLKRGNHAVFTRIINAFKEGRRSVNWHKGKGKLKVIQFSKQKKRQNFQHPFAYVFEAP